MRILRNWLWLLPAIAGGIPSSLAAVSLFQGEFATAASQALSAVALFVAGALIAAALTGALKSWAQWLGESLVAMFNFRAGGIAHHMWQIPVGATLLAALYCAFKLHFNTATITHVYVLIATVTFLSLYAALFLLNSRYGKPAFAAAGVVALALGFWLFNYKSSQIELYNAGIEAMDRGDLPAAIKLFDASVAAYKQESNRSQLARLVFPQPNKDLEARAHFQKGNCLVRARKPQDAVKAYKESLASNPGNNFDEDLSMAGAASRYNDHLHTAANLEKLFSSGQGGGKATGNGRQPGQGQQPGPSRERQPNPGAGRQPRDSL